MDVNQSVHIIQKRSICFLGVSSLRGVLTASLSLPTTLACNICMHDLLLTKYTLLLFVLFLPSQPPPPPSKRTPSFTVKKVLQLLLPTCINSMGEQPAVRHLLPGCTSLNKLTTYAWETVTRPIQAATKYSRHQGGQ